MLETKSLYIYTGVHKVGLFGCHGRPLCTASRLLSIKANDKISNAVSAGL